MKEEEIRKFVKEVIQLHYDAIERANAHTITNPDEFREWASKMAQIHATLTINLIFDIQNENSQPS